MSGKDVGSSLFICFHPPWIGKPPEGTQFCSKRVGRMSKVRGRESNRCPRSIVYADPLPTGQGRLCPHEKVSRSPSLSLSTTVSTFAQKRISLRKDGTRKDGPRKGMFLTYSARRAGLGSETRPATQTSAPLTTRAHRSGTRSTFDVLPAARFAAASTRGVSRLSALAHLTAAKLALRRSRDASHASPAEDHHSAGRSSPLRQGRVPHRIEGGPRRARSERLRKGDLIPNSSSSVSLQVDHLLERPSRSAHSTLPTLTYRTTTYTKSLRIFTWSSTVGQTSGTMWQIGTRVTLRIAPDRRRSRGHPGWPQGSICSSPASSSARARDWASCAWLGVALPRRALPTEPEEPGSASLLLR